MNKEFNKWWNSLTEKQKEEYKEIVIARIKAMPDNLRLCILKERENEPRI